MNICNFLADHTQVFTVKMFRCGNLDGGSWAWWHRAASLTDLSHPDAERQHHQPQKQTELKLKVRHQTLTWREFLETVKAHGFSESISWCQYHQDSEGSRRGSSHGSLQPSITTVLRDLMPSSDLSRHSTAQMQLTSIQAIYSYTYKIKIIKYLFKKD